MFPLKSGLGNVGTPDPNQVLYQSIAAAAMHEIGQQAIIDCSVLMFHQEAAEVYHRQAENIPLQTNPDNTFNVYSPSEKIEIRKSLIDVVMKFHIFDENGLGNRLTPIIRAMQTQVAMSPEELTDPFVQRVINGSSQYSASLYNQNVQQTLNQIMNYSAIENISEEDSAELIRNSYNQMEDTVDVAVFEDGAVQCACDYCESFFEILEKIQHIDRSELNPIQIIMMQNYNF